MTARRRTPTTVYSDAEKQFLLTGVPLHPHSTRFGHPIHDPPGLDVAAIRQAWDELGDELLKVWESEVQYQHYRTRYDAPFAVRLLEAEK